MASKTHACTSTHTDEPPTVAVWEFAGLLLTYWCNAKCAFCYVYSGPDRGGELSREDALAVWRGLDRVAAAGGKKMRVHLAGGEPLGDWPGLLSLVRAARDAGLSRLEKIETNAYWAVSDGLTRARLEQLDALGIDRLFVSADVYHQEFVPIERVRRCVRIAREVLGPLRVRVRWWESLEDVQDMRRMPPQARSDAFAAALLRHADRLTGRAADRLAAYLPRRPLAELIDQNCVEEVLHSRHVHVDPFGNVFPGVCNGIILGNAIEHGLEAVFDDFSRNWRGNPVVDAVVAGGSAELARRAMQLGYEPLADGYASKCHLCQHVRQFLFDRGVWRSAVGPAECYASAADKKEAAEWTSLVSLTRSGGAA
jgi:pyruvate-formate lyase-activating enzyme